MSIPVQTSTRLGYGMMAFVLVLWSRCDLLAQTRPESTPRAPREAGKVRSKDGTSIAYERSGTGPALVLVAPALADRSDSRRFAALLAPSFTVFNFDRRGRGESGDTQPFATEREIDDVEAIIEKAGGSAFLFGSSSGAVLALEAANRFGAKVKAAVLFEPPFVVNDSRPPVPDALFAEIAKLVAAGRRGDAVAQFMEKGIGVPEPMVAEMKLAPMWAAMEKLAHTLPYDGALMAGLQAGKPLPAKRWTSLRARTLVLDGSESPPFLRDAAEALTGLLPNAKRFTMAGQDHSAMFTAPQALVPVVVNFFLAASPGDAERERAPESRPR